MKKFFIVHNEFKDLFTKENWEVVKFNSYDDAKFMWEFHKLKWWDICIIMG